MEDKLNKECYLTEVILEVVSCHVQNYPQKKVLTLTGNDNLLSYMNIKEIAMSQNVSSVDKG